MPTEAIRVHLVASYSTSWRSTMPINAVHVHIEPGRLYARHDWSCKNASGRDCCGGGGVWRLLIVARQPRCGRQLAVVEGTGELTGVGLALTLSEFADQFSPLEASHVEAS